MDTDKKNDSKRGIFYSLKQRFWSRSSDKPSSKTKYCFKGDSKLKKKSESSHCNLSSNYENCYGEISQNETSQSCETSLRGMVTKSLSLNEPTISNYQVGLGPSHLNCSRETENVHANLGTLSISRPSEVVIERLGLHTEPIGNEMNTTEEASSSVMCARSSTLPEESGCEDSDSDNQYEEFGPNGTKSGLTCELLKLSKYGWYWGSLSKEEAEEKLTNQPDGAFLLRDSSADHFILSLSFRSSGKTLHTRIEYSLGRGLFSFYQQSEDSFATIAELIEHSMSFSKSAVFCYSRPRSPGHAAFPVRLTKPISRFAQVRSLQHLCRFVIRESIRLDYIEKLPLPSSIRGYIEESHY